METAASLKDLLALSCVVLGLDTTSKDSFLRTARGLNAQLGRRGARARSEKCTQKEEGQISSSDELWSAFQVMWVPMSP